MIFETTYCMNEWVITILLGREWFWVVFICGQSTHPCPFFICQWCRMSCTWGQFGERNMINYKLLHYYYTILPVISYAYWYTYIWNLFCTCKNVYILPFCARMYAYIPPLRQVNVDICWEILKIETSFTYSLNELTVKGGWSLICTYTPSDSFFFIRHCVKCHVIGDAWGIRMWISSRTIARQGLLS